MYRPALQRLLRWFMRWKQVQRHPALGNMRAPERNHSNIGTCQRQYGIAVNILRGVIADDAAN
jgi:hypothetical protein